MNFILVVYFGSNAQGREKFSQEILPHKKKNEDFEFFNVSDPDPDDPWKPKNVEYSHCPLVIICVRWQNPFFEAGAVEQQTTFQPGHLGRDFLYVSHGRTFDALMEVGR